MTSRADRTSTDAALVAACLAGDDAAWKALIEKYKNLVYSIPLKYRATPEEAADIFQAVCMELYIELPKLRKVESLPSWLITVASNRCFHWKRGALRRDGREGEPLEEAESLAVSHELSPLTVLEEAQREQEVRETVARLSEQCRELLRMLFYEDPPRPYADVAARLGLAVGSIGFTRAACLAKLERGLRAKRR